MLYSAMGAKENWSICWKLPSSWFYQGSLDLKAGALLTELAGPGCLYYLINKKKIMISKMVWANEFEFQNKRCLKTRCYVVVWIPNLTGFGTSIVHLLFLLLSFIISFFVLIIYWIWLHSFHKSLCNENQNQIYIM